MDVEHRGRGRCFGLFTGVVTGFVVAACGMVQLQTKPGNAAEPGAGASGAQSGGATATPSGSGAGNCQGFGSPGPGFQPFLPTEIGCGKGKTLQVAQVCKLETQGRGSVFIVPGMPVTVLGPAHISSVGARVKTADGKEGDADYTCLSKSPLGVSFVPKPGTPNDLTSVKALLKQMYEAARALDVQHQQILEKRGFAPATVNTPDELDLTARSSVADFYAKTLHKFIHGSNMDTATLLSLPEYGWLAAWPAIFSQTFSTGLKGADKSGAEPAVESLNLRGSLKSMGRELAGLKDEEKAVDAEVKNVPANQRENVKQQKLGEIKQRREKLTASMKEWQAKIDEAEKRVKFDDKPSAEPSARSSDAGVEPAAVAAATTDTAQPSAGASQAAAEPAGGAAAAPSAPAQSAVPAATATSPESDTKLPSIPPASKQTFAFAAGGLGIAGIAAGTVTLILGMNKANEGNANCSDEAQLCTQEGYEANQSARTLGTISTISFVVGAAALGASAYLFLSADRRSGSSTALAVGIDRSGAGAAVVRRF